MKQARRWLLLAAAMMLLPQAALAQKKKPKGTPPPAAAPAAAPAAPADADADAPAGAAAPGAAPAGSADATATPPPAGDTGGGMDICQITPDAPQCAAAKEINFGEEAKKQVHAEVYAVQQQYVIKAQRFEIMPYWQFTLNDQFVSHPGPGLALNYYITNVLAVGLNGDVYGGLNGETRTSTSRTAARRASRCRSTSTSSAGERELHVRSHVRKVRRLRRLHLQLRRLRRRRRRHHPDRARSRSSTPTTASSTGTRWSTSTSASASASSSSAGSPRPSRCAIYIYFEKLENLKIASRPDRIRAQPGTTPEPTSPTTFSCRSASRSSCPVLRIPVAQVKTKTRTTMKRRFVTTVLASVAAACVLSTAGAADAQELQLTGPLKGAPAVRGMRMYREGRFELAPTFSSSLLDEYRRSFLIGARLNYNIKDWIGVGVWGAFAVFSPQTDLTTQIDSTAPRDSLTATNVNHGGSYPNYTQRAVRRPDGEAQLRRRHPAGHVHPVPRQARHLQQDLRRRRLLRVAAPSPSWAFHERGACGDTEPAVLRRRVVVRPQGPAEDHRDGSRGVHLLPGRPLVHRRRVPRAALVVEPRGLRLARRRSERELPRQKIDSKDDTFDFNQMITLSVGFSFPTKPRISE